MSNVEFGWPPTTIHISYTGITTANSLNFIKIYSIIKEKNIILYIIGRYISNHRTFGPRLLIYLTSRDFAMPLEQPDFGMIWSGCCLMERGPNNQNRGWYPGCRDGRSSPARSSNNYFSCAYEGNRFKQPCTKYICAAVVQRHFDDVLWVLCNLHKFWEKIMQFLCNFFQKKLDIRVILW